MYFKRHDIIFVSDATDLRYKLDLIDIRNIIQYKRNKQNNE
jgi:hypothetical protein